MTLNGRQRRAALRYLHLGVGAAMATYAYLPPDAGVGLRWALMVLGVPLVTLTGLWMWKQAAIRRTLARLRSRGTAAASPADRAPVSP